MFSVPNTYSGDVVGAMYAQVIVETQYSAVISGIAGGSLSFLCNAPRGHEGTLVVHCMSISAEIHTLSQLATAARTRHSRCVLALEFSVESLSKPVDFVDCQSASSARNPMRGWPACRVDNPEKWVKRCQGQDWGQGISCSTLQRVGF